MKRALTLIPIVGIFTTGILVCVPKSASAYCVYNKAAFTIDAYDTNNLRAGAWGKTLGQGGKNCCPGDHKECQNATIHASKAGEDKNSKISCEARVDAHGWIVVHSISENGKTRLECRVNEPV
jgi:hypothetical protein